MDDLSKILNHISLTAEVFYTGNMCGILSLGGSDEGHLHILESGRLTVDTVEGHRVCLQAPAVIFIPNGAEHRIVSEESQGVKLICARIKFNSVSSNAFINALPQFIYHDINMDDPIGKTATWLFDEAFNQFNGRQAMIDKLTDIFILQVLRDVVSNGLVLQGVLSALTHPRLSTVIEAIHDEPQKQWSLESLADIAALSRSKFAALFKETVGQPPNNYITELRVAIAQNLLQKGKSVNLVANEVGYEHGSALARVFKKNLGVSPREWLNKQGQ